MNDNRFMLTYLDKNGEVYQWFQTENELLNFVKIAKNKYKDFKIVDAIEIIQYKELNII